MISFYMQGRVFADNEDEAALKVREQWGENGKLILKCVAPELRWYEYLVKIGAGKEPDGDQNSTGGL